MRKFTSLLLLGFAIGSFAQTPGRAVQVKKDALARLNIVGTPKHTPHDCRHTFSRLCETYGVRENDRKRMLGHSFGGDVTNAVYGHRTLEELRAEIEKIEMPFVTNCD